MTSTDTTHPTVPEAGPQPVERCDWIEAGQPYPNECGRTLPCDRHGTDHEGHPFGFTDHRCGEWFGGQYAHDYCRRDKGHDGQHSSVRHNADEDELSR